MDNQSHSISYDINDAFSAVRKMTGASEEHEIKEISMDWDEAAIEKMKE